MLINTYDELFANLMDEYKNNDKTLILIQGLPGAGKSTLASKLSEDTYWNYYEADMYFMINGEYVYNPKKLGEAHRWCQFATKNALKISDGCIVSNTFTCDKELAPYYAIAEEVGATVILIKMKSSYGSIHNVPTEAITRMRNKMSNQLTKKADYVINSKLNIKF